MKQKDTLKRCYIQDSTEHQPIWYICVLFDGNGDRDSILGNFSQGKMLRLDRRRWRWFSTPLTISTIYWVPVIFVAVTSHSGGGIALCTAWCWRVWGMLAIHHYQLLLENTDKTIHLPYLRQHCTLVLHSRNFPVVLNSYNLGNGNVARREFRIISK